MNLTRLSVSQPAAVLAVVAIVTLFGLLSIAARPIQLLPELSEPKITIFNNWRQAAPAEMESYIIEPQENVLRNTPGVQEISSMVARGFGRIELTFDVGTNMDQALINVINNLNQTPPLPRDAGEPFVASGGQGIGDTVATMQIYPKRDNPNQNLYSPDYQKLFDNVIEPRLTAIPGVSRVNMAGRRDFEVRITFDPYRTAALGIPISGIVNTISGANDVSGGFVNVGRRQYTVRFVGKDDIDELDNLIVAWSDDRPIQLSEVASIEKRMTDPFGVNMRNGYRAYYVTLGRANDSNTVSILDEVNATIAELNAGPVGDAGLIVELSFDSSVYIRRAISLVRNNLGLGVLLAVGVLWFFLRDYRATLIIAMSIPLSLTVAFIALKVFNLSLNVISLAGLAFSVGLVLDAAIIVQENIIRFRQQGEPIETAVQHGANQVKGALFAATMTTIAIFLPILFMAGQIGQLFSDLALTLSVAVMASMIVALSVIPVASNLWLKHFNQSDPVSHWWSRVTALVMRLTDTSRKRIIWVVSLTVIPVALALALKPNADFLPSAQADAVTVFFNVPPGINNDLFENEIAAEVVNRLRPHMDHEKEPYIRGYNLAMFGTFNVLYLYPLKPEQTEEFLQLLRGPLLQGIPDTQAFASRATLLGGISFDAGRAINVHLHGADIVGLMESATVGLNKIREIMPKAVVRPVPGLTLAEPELQVVPNERLITQAGLNRQDVANAVRALTGGLFINEYFDGNDRYDVILKAGDWNTPEEFAAMPIATPLAGAQTIGSLTEIRRTVGPTQLQRFDGQRTISLQVLPPDEMTVEEALKLLRTEVGPAISATLPSGSSITYRGSADRLEGALNNMLVNFLLAVLILFVVMAAIFKSVRDSLLVLLVMPLALAGGLLSLRALNLVAYQSLDMLTMIGFIILLGLVVNNAILLVSQTRDGERNGMRRSEAVKAAVRVRARPVYMSTLTSVFGMLPLAVIPGIGSDIYRGLATVIVGGMLFSAAFTLILMPALLRMGAQGDVFASSWQRLRRLTPTKVEPSSMGPLS